jgi:hypothetical protein
MLKQVFAATLIFAFLAVLFTGCQESNYPSRYNTYRAPSETQSEGYSRNNRYKAAGLLTELQAHAARNPSDLEGAQAYVYEIEEAAPGTPVEASARKILEQVRSRLEEVAQRKYKKALDKARDLADLDLYERAMQVLEDFSGKYRGTASASNASDERLKYAKAREAKSVFKTLVHNANTYRSVKEYDEALEYIKKQKLQEQLKGTKYEQLFSQFKSKITDEAEENATEKARITALPWEDITNAGQRSWSSDGGLWTVESGKIKGINPNRNYGMFITGEDNWKDYIISLRFTIRGGDFDLGVRGKKVTQFRRTYKTFDVCSELRQKDRPVDMIVTVRSNTIAIESPSLPETRYMRLTEPDGSFKHTYGPICVFLHRGAQVEFSKFKVKHLGKVAQPTAER